MEQDKKEIPLLYCYIYRNLKNGTDIGLPIEFKEVIIRMRKVIHTAPRVVYEDIFDEFINLGLIKRINSQRCIIIYNAEAEKRLKKLNDYAFPLNKSP